MPFLKFVSFVVVTLGDELTIARTTTKRNTKNGKKRKKTNANKNWVVVGSGL
jgi:hypothetical protein